MYCQVKGLVFTLLLFFLLPFSCLAGSPDQGHPATDVKGPAILLVTFGTSVPSAQVAFVNIEKQVRATFPGTEIRWAYTSKIIRKKLAKNGVQIDSPETAMAKLMDDGYTKVVVQSLHMITGAEFHEIYANTKLFEQMSGGIGKVVVSYPMLTTDESMERVLQAIVADVVPKERKPGEAVVLMGHGTHHPSDAIYSALMYKLQKRDANMYIGTVEGHPTFDEVKEMLVKKGIKKAYLVPFMTVAGDHALNDMAGDEADSWKSQLSKAGIESVPVLKGLAEVDSLVALWIDNLKIAMGQVK
ncbi:MAG: sirohydrochlorin cobaltochelatase [Desulfobulbaceae bacterium]|nr:sirohydrochlorin cobaltochelatase [Desulfobulbaceae bacterium]